MTPSRRLARGTVGLLLVATLLSACAPPTTHPSPGSSAGPTPTLSASARAAEAARLVARRFVAAWRARHYEQLVALIAPSDRDRYTPAAITGLLRQFDELAGVTRLVAEAGPAIESSLPSATASEGPVPAFEVPISFAFETTHFGRVAFRRTLVLTEGVDGWYARWRPSLLFPQLGDGDILTLKRTLGPRGRILSANGTVFADTRADGMRVYPQDWLAGQTIGYVAPVTAAEVAALPPSANYQVGDPMGRSGLEQGAEDLLRGRAGIELLAAPASGDPKPLLDLPVVPGADLTITIRPDLQATAEAALAPYSDAATAALDPKTGDVWALASAPRFNPNAMTLGTTMAGQPLPKPTAVSWLNRAVLAAYPAGSSFKPFTLLAALETGVATPATRMPCNGTWTYSGFTFHNYLDHTLGSSVSLEEAMAFSCNTTYMPLSIRVWDTNRQALPDLVGRFGFGVSTGIVHLADAPGILPDAHYFEVTPRGGGTYKPYGPFDQIQLAIGQGSFLGTPLQLANAYAAFGNGGTLWVPRIVMQATLPDGRVLERIEPRAIRQVNVAPESFAYLAKTLRAVITLSYGTAHRAFAGFPIAVAGKSGTAETGTPKPDAWFPAYAPIGDAQIAVATVLVHVKLATGGTDAAPLVRRVMTRYFYP
ncbi:MAG: penicillin-binding transpeptidase domain-containing protein [Chloroflexota bacterium]|nr:penicillin-binding transpeptidase domain-containing protein [Chloroflexota bacterium]